VKALVTRHYVGSRVPTWSGCRIPHPDKARPRSPLLRRKTRKRSSQFLVRTIFSVRVASPATAEDGLHAGYAQAGCPPTAGVNPLSWLLLMETHLHNLHEYRGGSRCSFHGGQCRVRLCVPHPSTSPRSFSHDRALVVDDRNLPDLSALISSHKRRWDRRSQGHRAAARISGQPGQDAIKLRDGLPPAKSTPGDVSTF
jgi:hypothetical protein